jgi:hypothetical protein
MVAVESLLSVSHWQPGQECWAHSPGCLFCRWSWQLYLIDTDWSNFVSPRLVPLLGQWCWWDRIRHRRQFEHVIFGQLEQQTDDVSTASAVTNCAGTDWLVDWCLIIDNMQEAGQGMRRLIFTHWVMTLCSNSICRSSILRLIGHVYCYNKTYRTLNLAKKNNTIKSGMQD